MFGEPETVYLRPKSAFDFGLVKQNLSKTKKGGYNFQPISITEQNDTTIINGELDEKAITLKYKKEKLSDKQKVFIAWIYLLTENYKNRENNKKLAIQYLEEGLKENFKEGIKKRRDKWAFPYYLIARYDLDFKGISDIRAELYRFIQKPEPLFIDFYKEILRQEKNPIRKVAVAKIAEKFYPTDDWFTGEIATDLFKQKKYKECITYIISVKKRYQKNRDWQRAMIRTTLLKCYLKTKKFKEALNELKTPLIGNLWSEDYSSLLRGVVYCHQRKWKEAIKNLEKTILSDFHDTDSSRLASYYLIKCYTATKNNVKLEQIISHFPLKHDELFLYEIPFHYGDDAIKILKQSLRSKLFSERITARIKGILAYLIYAVLPLTDTKTGIKRRPTGVEKFDINKAIILTKEALAYYPEEIFFNALYSNLLYEKESFDEAMNFKLRSLARDTGIDSLYAEAELQKCSEEYINNYPNRIKEIFALIQATPENYIENYNFDSDVETFWKRQAYEQIVELFNYVKPYIKDYSKIGEISEHIGGGLFEIAYSFNEVGNSEEAKKIYERYIEVNGETTSVLNNLALIYEKNGNLAQAKKTITHARKIMKEPDEIINRNYKRLHSETSNNQNRNLETTRKIRKKDDIKIDTKDGLGLLFIKNDKVELGSVENIPFKLLNALLPFGSTKGTNNIFRLSSSGRSKFNGEELSLLEKQSILRNRIKELQEILKKKKIRIRLFFDENNETVLLKLK